MSFIIGVVNKENDTCLCKIWQKQVKTDIPWQTPYTARPGFTKGLRPKIVISLKEKS